MYEFSRKRTRCRQSVKNITLPYYNTFLFRPQIRFEVCLSPVMTVEKSKKFKKLSIIGFQFWTNVCSSISFAEIKAFISTVKILSETDFLYEIIFLRFIFFLYKAMFILYKFTFTKLVSCLKIKL